MQIHDLSTGSARGRTAMPVFGSAVVVMLLYFPVEAASSEFPDDESANATQAVAAAVEQASSTDRLVRLNFVALFEDLATLRDRTSADE